MTQGIDTITFWVIVTGLALIALAPVLAQLIRSIRSRRQDGDR